jgi:hypothetical protein
MSRLSSLSSEATPKFNAKEFVNKSCTEKAGSALSSIRTLNPFIKKQ